MTTTVLLVGRFTPERRAEMAAAVARGGGEPRAYETIAEAERSLAEEALAPHGLFLDGAEHERGAAFLVRLRGDVRHHSTPIVWVAPTANEQAFGVAHAVGAEDALVLGDDAGVVRRVALMREVDPGRRPELTQGPAIVAHGDLSRRRIVGRTLRAAGFDPQFAADAAELAQLLAESRPGLVVLSGRLPPDGGLAAARRVDPAIPLVLFAEAGASAAALRDALRARGQARVLPEEHPAADLLFLANELLRPDVSNLRASARRLHATLCAFRPAGELHATFGLTYNLSREGIYVRTLDPPRAGATVWLELRPPGERAAAHLRGAVVWARGPHGGGGAAPPGFAVRLDPEACPPPDLVAYALGYDALTD